MCGTRSPHGTFCIRHSSDCHPPIGSRVFSSGNSEKSRSRVRSASAPWATHIAAILASWTTPPYHSGATHKTLQYPRKILGLTNQPYRRRGHPGSELTPRLLLTRGIIPPAARVRHHAEELIAAGPGNSPRIVAFRQTAYDRRSRIVVPRFATVRIYQQIRVNGNHRDSGSA